MNNPEPKEDVGLEALRHMGDEGWRHPAEAGEALGGERGSRFGL